MSSKKINPKTFVGNVPNPKWGDSQVKIVLLNSQAHLDSTLFYLKKGWEIEFHLGPTLFGQQIKLFTNLPNSAAKDFERNNYQLLEWKNDDNPDSVKKFNDYDSLYATILLNRAGSFHYYFTNANSNESLGSGYFIVDPVISFANGEFLNLESLKCQTVLSKSLGTFDEWENRLKVSKESGYNMIHFTPIQELGSSNSSYSLKNQMQLNPAFSKKKGAVTFDDVLKLTNKMRQDWKVLSLGDVVLNHTANDSPWLLNHPECTYNMITAPYLRPAAILDGHLHVFSKEVSQGKFENYGIPKEIHTEDHLLAIKYYLETELIPQLHLYEFYTTDVDQQTTEFVKKLKNVKPGSEILSKKQLKLTSSTFAGRNQAKVNLDNAIKIFNVIRIDIRDEQKRILKSVEDFKKHLMELNNEARKDFRFHIDAAINNCMEYMRYFRIQEDGPKQRAVTEEQPLFPRYFTGEFADHNSVETEILNNGQYVMAHNGWVKDSDPLKSFIDPDSNVYLRRELFVWGDSVKLRYGDCTKDCPFLWELMRQYIETTAKVFDGIRLDNCHSTPLHVAEYLLDCARKIRPDLYVVAELFTESEIVDNKFINRLGINSLIRESMTAFDSHELGRLVYRFGGEPVGSFHKMTKSPLRPGVAHALFYDVTHDNPSLIEKRNIFDLIPTAAMVSMACCAIGSTRGFDELVPHQINVVNEKRLYASWLDDIHTGVCKVGINTGIIAVKKALNKLHEELSENGFNEIFVDQMSEDIIAVTRHNPSTHENIILVAHTAFKTPTKSTNTSPVVKNLKVEGEFSEILLEVQLLNKNKENKFASFKNFERNKVFINGVTDYEVVMKQNINLQNSKILIQVDTANRNFSEFKFDNFMPGTVIIIRIKPCKAIDEALQHIKNISNSFLNNQYSQKIISVVSELTLTDLNFALYRCSEEDAEEGTGSYVIPGYGPLVYCGLQGFESVLKDLKLTNDLGHLFCENLRQGDWMLDYIFGRLKTFKGTLKLGLLFQKMFESLRQIPRYLMPKYFEIIISSMYRLLLSRAFLQMSKFIQEGSTLVRSLGLGSVQCVGMIESAPLPLFSASMIMHGSDKRKITLSAGLPHFSTGFMRSWGRDTFISLRGLLLLTGRFEEARYHILGYSACLRHGLIPNLLDKGVNARYNCRDAVWWWLYSIISFVDLVPRGHEILKENVSRIFPDDESPPLGPGLANQLLHDVMQEALSVHFKGLSFRERSAGFALDSHMTDKGFNNEIGVNLETGFVFGGNEFNCGTWMDKMGSDLKTGNKGKPATPRNGSAVELVGLCKAVVSNLHRLNEAGFYPYNAVERVNSEGKVVRWSFKYWAEKISENFEKFFWIPEAPAPWEDRPDLIHRNLIYKDCLGSTERWADYQLRPNFLIALVVAPEMVRHNNAWTAIKKAEHILCGPLGMKTLDPADWNYNGDYNNDDDSDNPKVAKGFNYHQGPEWVWLVGYYLRAKLYFARKQGPQEFKKAIIETRAHLGNHYQEIFTSHWRGLPELTNKNGAFCAHGCRIQAWSMGCILEVLYDLYLIEKDSSK